MICQFELETGGLLQTFGLHNDIRTQLAASPDGELMLSRGMDGTLLQWQLGNPTADELRAWIAANRFVRDLTCGEQELFQIRISQSIICAVE